LTPSSRSFSALWDGLGVTEGDHLFVHSSLALALGNVDDATATELLESLAERVGDLGTIVLPAFTYSLGRGENFSRESSAGLNLMGALSGAAHRMNFYRTPDPMFSMLCSRPVDRTGPLDPERSCSFGPESTFGKMFDRNYKVVCLGLDLGSTLLHEIEVRLQVDYRFWKAFPWTNCGRVTPDSQEVWWTSVRSLDDPDTQADFRAFHEMFRNHDAVTTVKAGRRSSYSYFAQDCFAFLKEQLPILPKLLTRGGRHMLP